jgi:dimethylargininase
MKTAIIRRISPCIGLCELTYLSRRVIDLERAIKQQQSYVTYLERLGLSVLSLPQEQELPDAVFVEDTAVVVDEVAVITRMGAISRLPETKSVAAMLDQHRPLRFINPEGTLEGGDVVRVGRTFYVGVSTRTNREGVAQLRSILEPYDYEVRPVNVTGCLHLGTGAAYLGRGLLLVNRSWVDAEAFQDLELIDVHPSEHWAANVLVIGEHILMQASGLRTARLVHERGFKVEMIDISEFEKAEAGLTCMSIIFNDHKPNHD